LHLFSQNEAMTGKNSRRGNPMRASRFTTLILFSILISPIASLAQSQSGSTENTNAPPAPMNVNFVSVQELKMLGKGHKAYEHGVRLLLKGDAAASLFYFVLTPALSRATKPIAPFAGTLALRPR
jgi:xanthine/uracil permease